MTTDTASITLRTGLPGSGKTLRTVCNIRDELAKGTPVYVCNLRGLRLPGVIPWDDPTRWEELPPGSLLVVDEAQQFFRARRGGEVPPYIRAMETIRHSGVRLLLTTQQPGYLDVHLRGLVGQHEHMLRIAGAQKAHIFRSPEVIEDVKSLRARRNADFETWHFDESAYALYDSADVHTMKWRMPTAWKRGAIAVACAGIVAAGLFTWLYVSQSKAARAQVQPTSTSAGGPASMWAAPVPAASDPPTYTAEEWLARQMPRSPAAPWSAPIFDGREPVSEPRVYCMSSDLNCRCVTEQGSVYTMDDALCRVVARYGMPYNPWQRPREDRAEHAPPRPLQSEIAAF